MAKKTDSNVYTIVFSIAMVVVVGSLLAFIASSLKPTITENERYEKQQNILYAMGVNNNESSSDVTFIPTTEVEAVFQQYIAKQYVIKGGAVSEDNEAYLIDLAKEESMDKDERRYPLFVGEKDGETYYIVPMRGKGLWDAIWGYIAVDKDFVVKGVFFDHKGETPGLGANIKERYFMDDFKGEHILSNSGDFQGIAVAKGNADPVNNRKEDHKVDALAGATITGDGVSAMIQKYLRTYLPYIKKIKNQ